jgi:hypothetical protein
MDKVHDPKKDVSNHYLYLKMIPPFQHEDKKDEVFLCGVKYYEEVLAHVLGTHKIDNFLDNKEMNRIMFQE